MSDNIKALPPLQRGQFAYGSNGFTVNGIAPVSPSLLRELVFPEQIKGKRLQKQRLEEARKIMTKPWIQAQLRYYEIGFKSSCKVAELKMRLVESVQHKNCAAVPVHVETIENSLRVEYDKKNSDHVQSQKTARKEKYDKLVSPTAKADYDVDLFLDEFFLSDQSRAIKAIRLPGLANRSEVHGAAEKIHGLHTVSHGREPNRTLAVGWDRHAVFTAAASASAEHSKQRQTQEDAAWEAIMKKHQALVKKCNIPKTDQHVPTNYYYGNFAIRCDEIAAQWPKNTSSYNLRFVGGRSAIFNFGVLEGVMRFGPDRESVMCDEHDSEEDDDTDSDDEDDEDDDTDSDDEDDEDDDTDSDDEDDDKDESPPLKTPPSNRTVANPLKRTMNNPSPSVPAPKRAKQTPPSSPLTTTTTPTPLRLYFQWRGRETGESQIQLDSSETNPTHTGYLDFPDARCVTFSGVGDFGFVGHEIKFEGFKTQFMGGPATKKWEDYSEEVYETKRVGRWR